MESGHVIFHIMTEIKNCNGANVIASPLLPPIGVFWDIENIQVPKGKSASVLVCLIRERFFKDYREAEFMCVCDINKESKPIIQELNNAQVTVVHVDATSKNAADEKLRQCMRRFVDTHGSPATILLISDDVNFATDLSDFRHRHHVRIILLHRDHVAEPLLSCAHEHYNFADLISNLPWRSPQKATCSRPRYLVVTDMPSNLTISNLRKHLARLSNNCGGKVTNVTKNKAIISFANADAAERAQKRMDKHMSYGQKLSVNFLHPDSSEFKEYVIQRNLFKDSGSHAGVSCSSGSSRDSSPHCDQFHSCELGKVEFGKAFGFPAPPVLNHQNLPSFLKSPLTKVGINTENQGAVASSDRLMTSKGEEGTQRQLPDPVGFGMNFNNLPEKCDRFSSLHQQNNGTFSPSDMMHLLGKNEGTCNQELAIPVELFVTNLDQTIEVNEMKKILLCMFREHVMVIHISMLLQPDGNTKAVVKVPSSQDAQYAISQLQRKKIGHKRILISHVTNDRNPPFSVLKSEVISLLKDIPSKRLPVFTFREVYEKRYSRAISVSELYKMREAVTVYEDASNGRMVSLNANYQISSSPSDSESAHSQDLAVLEKPYCELHFHPTESEGWAEQQGMAPLPDVFISLKMLSPAIHTLLDKHQGSLPLNSFCACYEAEIGPLPIVTLAEESDERLTGAESRPSSRSFVRGIPLEHLISCVAGVEITKTRFCFKKVQWCENKSLNQPVIRSVSPALAGPLAVFGREVTDLLKNHPRCIVMFNKFIPEYHHHFGRQCRVADYGFTKLIDLLESIPHIIQVLGDGQNRLVTLTHRMQVKRFAADLLRILKSRACKRMTLLEFPLLYEQSTEKVFEILNYGVCSVHDMLAEVADGAVVVTNVEEEGVVIAIPKREQTKEEMERTKSFSTEVIELLKHTPTCTMVFNKFIPAYHHHFGKQCRVADFGFSKLIELFEAIPFIEITGTGEDKVIHLAEKERNEILVDRLAEVLKAHPDKMIALPMLPSAYVKMHGHVLRPQDFGASDVLDLLRKLSASLKVIEGFAGEVVTLADEEFINQVSLRIRRLLMAEPDGQMSTARLNQLYQKRFGHKIPIDAFATELENIIKVESDIVKLTPLQLCARDMVVAIQDINMPLSLPEFEGEFLKKHGVPLKPSLHGFSGIPAMLQSLKEYFVIMKKKRKWSVQLNKKNCESPITVPSGKEEVVAKKSVSTNTSEDILVQQVQNSPSSSSRIGEAGFVTPPSARGASAGVQNDAVSLCHFRLSPIKCGGESVSRISTFGFLPRCNSLLHCPAMSSPPMSYFYPSPPSLQRPLMPNTSLYLPQSIMRPCGTASPDHQFDRGTISEPQTPVKSSTQTPKSHTRSSTPLMSSRNSSFVSIGGRRSRIAACFSNPIDS